MAAQDARQRELATVLKMRGLHHVGQRGLFIGNAKPLRRRSNTGRFVAQRLHQAQHAVFARGTAEQHRTNLSFAQLAGEIIEHRIARRRNVLKQLLEQPIVVIGELFQHGEPSFLLAIEIARFEIDHFRGHVLAIDECALQREIDEAGDQIALPDRYLPQHQRRARRRLQDCERFANTLVGLVDLVQEKKARNPEIFQFAHDDLQLRQLALVSFADDHSGIDRRQCRAHIVREFDGAGTIDKGVAVTHEGGCRRSHADAHAMAARLRRRISDGVACFDCACF